MTKDENKSKRKNLSVSAGFIHVVRYRYISRYLYSPKRIREPLLARWTEHMRAYYFSSKQQRFFFFKCPYWQHPSTLRIQCYFSLLLFIFYEPENFLLYFFIIIFRRLYFFRILLICVLIFTAFSILEKIFSKIENLMCDLRAYINRTHFFIRFTE